jgi:hypothetical protein
MRYFFLLTRPITLLPGGIVDATGASAPVLLPGPLDGFPSGSTTAAIGAITLTVITMTTHDHLGVAATTLVKAAG